MKNRILIIFFISTYLGAQTSGRFEQSVFYSIDAQLNTSDNIVFGKERVVYTNHSPDTLRVIYFHQYANAFRKNSNMQAYQLARNGWSYMNYLPKKYLGGMRISNVRDDAGVALPTKEDDTIFEIHLIKALAPGESISLSMEFELTIPVLMRRMGHDNREGIDYSMAQWYPKVCVYDENGWHKNYYLAREFYGEFATWDVSITLPAHYTVGGSGSLTNATSIDSMIVKDPWSTFSDRVFPESARVDSFFPLRTWRYHAERIHDFAWCADPEYLVESFESQGTRINLLYLPDVKARWQKMKIWTSEILRYMNEHVGKYPYPEFTIAQGGDGGMEYPSIVFITGRRGEFSLATVTTHEMVHNWFYGLIANDESREAWMDEGITSYYTTRLAEHFFGRNASVSYETPFQQKYYPKKDAREETLTDYLWWAKQGFEEKVLTESDFFKSDQSYAMATYYKGQVFMWTLEYLYGRDRTDSLIRNFFLEHNRHHTHTDDLKRSLEKQTGAELEWLFDAWFNSLATCDYAIENYHTKKVDSKFVTQISFFRKGDLELPVDFFVRLKNDSLFGFRIPAHGDDPDKQGLMRLPLWNKTDRKYYAYISFSSDVKSIEIDTSLLMPDIHRGNNTSGFPKTDWRWQMPVAAIPTLDRYTIEHRPSMWYNRIDAADIGYRFEGVFGKDERRTNAALYYGTKSGEVDYELSYSTPWNSLGRQTAGYVKSFHSHTLDNGVTNLALVEVVRF